MSSKVKATGEKSNGASSYQRQLKGKNSAGSKSFGERTSNRRTSTEAAQQRIQGDDIDARFGFERFKEVLLKSFKNSRSIIRT